MKVGFTKDFCVLSSKLAKIYFRNIKNDTAVNSFECFIVPTCLNTHICMYLKRFACLMPFIYCKKKKTKNERQIFIAFKFQHSSSDNLNKNMLPRYLIYKCNLKTL